MDEDLDVYEQWLLENSNSDFYPDQSSIDATHWQQEMYERSLPSEPLPVLKPLQEHRESIKRNDNDSGRPSSTKRPRSRDPD